MVAAYSNRMNSPSRTNEHAMAQGGEAPFKARGNPTDDIGIGYPENVTLGGIWGQKGGAGSDIALTGLAILTPQAGLRSAGTDTRMRPFKGLAALSTWLQ